MTLRKENAKIFLPVNKMAINRRTERYLATEIFNSHFFT